MEVSLILRVLPRYIRCHYYLPYLFSTDWLSHPSILSFPEGSHSHPSAAFITWIGTTTQLLINFLKVWHCHIIAILSCGLALPPNCYFILWIGLISKLLLTITVD